jgi:hypothetical protein
LDFAQLEQRIDVLCAQAASRKLEPELVAEIEWVLGEGYLRALEGDQATRRLRSRLAIMREHWVALQGGASV